MNKIVRNDVTRLDNTCIYRQNGCCIKCGESCPGIVKYSENNDNNLPCDMVGYEPTGESL